MPEPTQEQESYESCARVLLLAKLRAQPTALRIRCEPHPVGPGSKPGSDDPTR